MKPNSIKMDAKVVDCPTIFGLFQQVRRYLVIGRKKSLTSTSMCHKIKSLPSCEIALCTTFFGGTRSIFSKIGV